MTSAEARTNLLVYIVGPVETHASDRRARTAGLRTARRRDRIRPPVFHCVQTVHNSDSAK